MSGRPDISMSAEEIEEFLALQGTAVVVATYDGSDPVASVARFDFTDGTIEIALRVEDPVHAALLDDPRTCCIAEQAPSYYEIKAVMLRGIAEPSGLADHGEQRFRLAVTSSTSFDFGRLAASLPVDSEVSVPAWRRRE